MDIFLALGANLGDCAKTFVAAIDAIERSVGSVKAVSRFSRSKALLPDGAGGQPDYLNAVLLCKTKLQPLELLQELLKIEIRFGRERSSGQRWQPRTIDLDILSYGNSIIASAEISIPHPEMHKRRFVLEPLCEIAPDWQHPIIKLSAKELLVLLC